MDKTIYNQVKEYFVGNRIVDENISINNDLEFIGDDAYIMFLEFSKKFEVDISSLNFDKYFLPELIFKYWYWKWFSPNKLREKPPITLRHLAEVVEKGEWFDPTLTD